MTYVIALNGTIYPGNTRAYYTARQGNTFDGLLYVL